MTQEKHLKQIDDALKNPSSSPGLWTKVKGFLETAADRNKTVEVVQFKDGSILNELYKAMERNIHSGQTDTIDDILESITMLSETAQGREIGWLYIKTLLEIIVKRMVNFDTNLEICKHLNLLLGKLPKPKLAEQKKALEFDEFLKEFEKLLKEAGDYDLQATLVEAALRILEATEKEKHASRWFSTENVKAAFLAIKHHDFENGCRNFLNIMNDSCGESRSVNSIPCNGFYLGLYKMNVPDGLADRHIWVDFNRGSKSISAFVRDDSCTDDKDSSWETMIIKVQHVRDLRINDSGDAKILILKLIMPASELIPFCPKSSEHYVKILFSKEQNISLPISSLFGSVRYVDLPYSSPSICSTPSKASTAMEPFVISSQKDRHARGLKLHEFLREPPFFTMSREEKAPNTSDSNSKTLACNQNEVSISKKLGVEATKDESPLQTATVTSQENIDDVIPETQDAKLEIIQKPYSKPMETKQSKKLKSLIRPRMPRPRKAKSSTSSPFTYKEPGSSKDETTSSNSPMKAGTLKMQNDKTVKNCGGKTTSPKTKEIQEQCIATDEIQEYNLDQEETKSRLSFTDPRKRKKNMPKKTFENFGRKKKRNNDTLYKTKSNLKIRSKVRGKEGNNTGRFPSDSDSESSLSIPPHPVKSATERRRGTTRKRRYSESGSETSYMFSEYKSKGSNKNGGVKKPRKRDNAKRFNEKSNAISIADLVSLYDNRKVQEESYNDKYMNKSTKNLKQDSKSKDTIELFEDSSEDMTPLSIVQEGRASRFKDVVVNDEENESSESDDVGKQPYKMPFRVQHKKGEYLRKKSKPERKKIRKECLANKQSEISDFENEAGNKEELKSKEENHTFSEELLSPVTSFAKICQSILDKSNRCTTIQLSDDESDANGGEVDNVKKFLDSGIVSDTSARRPYGVSSFDIQEEFPINSITTKLVETPAIDVESDNEKEKDAKNKEEESDGYGKDIALPHLKTPEVVREFRNKCKLKEKQNQNMSKKQTIKSITTFNDDEEIEPWRITSPKTRKRNKSTIGKSEKSTGFNDENTPFASRVQSIPSYGVGSLLETLRHKVTGAIKKKENELQRFTNAAADLVNDKLKNLWSMHREERLDFLSDFDKKMKEEVNAVKQNTYRQQKRQEKFLEMILKNQHENIQASKDQMKRIDNLEKANSILISGIKELEEKHKKNENTAEEKLRKEISKLHAKLVNESRQKEMLSVRKTLHNVLSTM